MNWSGRLFSWKLQISYACSCDVIRCCPFLTSAPSSVPENRKQRLLVDCKKQRPTVACVQALVYESDPCGDRVTHPGVVRGCSEGGARDHYTWLLLSFVRRPSRQHLLYSQFPHRMQEICVSLFRNCWHLGTSAKSVKCVKSIFQRLIRFLASLQSGEYRLSSVWSTGAPNKKCLLSSSLWSTIQK